MSLGSCPNCYELPCMCEQGLLGSKIYAYDQLLIERDELKRQREGYVNKLFRTEDEYKKLLKERDGLLDFIIKTGHAAGCDYYVFTKASKKLRDKCSCGYNDLIDLDLPNKHGEDT